MQALGYGPRTLAGLARSAPKHVGEWHFRRLLKAGYWSMHLLVTWFSQQVMAALPAPLDRVIYVMGDGSHKDKRGKQNPVVQKGRKSKENPWFFGIRFVVIMACWDVYRIPVGFRIILPKDHPHYKKENVLFREMVEDFEPPAWVRRVIVCGDSAYGSKQNMEMIKKRDKSDRRRQWGFVFSIARTWSTEEGKKIKDLVNHLPRKRYKKTWIAKLPEERGRKVFWIWGKRIRLNHIGDVTVVLSKKGRNDGPKKVKILVTNLPELTLRQVVSTYQRRWSIEILFKELKSGLGLGEHQVTREEGRIEKSIGISVLAYLFLIRCCKEDIHPGQSWSIFKLQNSFRLKVITNQIEHNMQTKFNKLQKAA